MFNQIVVFFRVIYDSVLRKADWKEMVNEVENLDLNYCATITFLVDTQAYFWF